MTQEKTELLKLLETVTKKNTYRHEKIKHFTQKLYEHFKVDIRALKLFRVTDLKEIKHFEKLYKIQNPRMILVDQDFRHAVLTNFETKHKQDSIGYYQGENVRIKRDLERGDLLFIVYCDDENKKNKNAELRNKRYESIQNSDLDYKSILYRDKRRSFYGAKDKSSYRTQINKLYKKMFQKFIDSPFEEFVKYITAKELKLYQEYQAARNQIMNSNQRDVYVSGYSIPSFDYPIRKIREQLQKLNNKEAEAKRLAEKYQNQTYEEHLANYIEWETDELNRAFWEIIEKERDFKKEINNIIRHSFDK